MAGSYIPGQSPVEAVRRLLDDWPNDFDEYWRGVLEVEGASYLEQEAERERVQRRREVLELCGLAPRVVHAVLAQKLTAEVESELRRFGDGLTRIEALDPRRLLLVPAINLIWHHYEHTLLSEVLGRIEKRGEVVRREAFQRLLLNVLEEPPNEIALQYLRRVAWLYLLGLEEECVAMCRVVLESALKFRISASVCESVLEQRPVELCSGREKSYSLEARIIVAAMLRYWDPRPCPWDRTEFTSEEGRAHLIRETGNQVVHPSVQKQAEGTAHTVNASKSVMDLAHLLRRLFRDSGGFPPYAEG